MILYAKCTLCYADIAIPDSFQYVGKRVNCSACEAGYVVESTIGSSDGLTLKQTSYGNSESVKSLLESFRDIVKNISLEDSAKMLREHMPLLLAEVIRLRDEIDALKREVERERR